MRLSSRFLLVSLVTLLLPWAGCQYLRDVETALRQGQADALAASASAIAAGLATADLGPLLSPARFDPQRTEAPDVYAHSVKRRPVIDGFVDDWGLEPGFLRPLGQGDFRVNYAAARDKGSVYLYLEVVDNDVVYGEPDRSDQVRLRVGFTEAGSRDLIFTTRAPGTVIPVTPMGDRRLGMEGSWQPTSTGYGLEIRLPAGWVGDRLGFLVTDYRRDGARRMLGTLPDLASEPGWLVYRSPGFEDALSRSALPGARLKLVDGLGYVLADTGAPAAQSAPGSSHIMRKLVRLAVGDDERLDPPPGLSWGRLDLSPYQEVLASGKGDRRFRSTTSARVTLASARRLEVRPPAQALLIVEQDTDAILSATDRAASLLVTASFVASISAVALLLTFAGWLSWRIGRLSSAASRALTGAGEIRPSLPEGRSADELGELSRNFSRLLGRVAEYNTYLKTLGQKLTHELRTPMAVVLTSLENLQADPAGPEARVYLRRAQEGLRRLQAMVSALGAATRVEQAMAGAEDELFDLGAVAGELFRTYSETHSSSRMELDLPEGACPVKGSPELIAQMLDKLFENALDFCPPDGRIRLSLEKNAETCRLRVANTGSRLAEGLGDQLFESLVSAREGETGPPHLGLGLYIARLIAHHHGGDISARNLPEGKGVEFIVEIPLGTASTS